MKPAQRKLFWSGAAWAARQRYTDLEVVGSGANAVVVRATDGLTGRPVAIKRISAVFFAPEEAIRVLREVRLLSHFTHLNVLSLKTLIYPKDPSAFDTVFIVTAYCETDLRQLLAWRPVQLGRAHASLAGTPDRRREGRPSRARRRGGHLGERRR